MKRSFRWPFFRVARRRAAIAIDASGDARRDVGLVAVLAVFTVIDALLLMAWALF